MGLTNQSTGTGVLQKELNIEHLSQDEYVIALAGNPNVGKSTVFNSLTGLNQHTGNWPGKTVTNACGKYRHRDRSFIMVDLPGTYSLMANSVEEEAARDFVCFGNPDATIIVTDATCLERNLNLVLQTLEITKKAVVCVNLMDEAERKRIKVDCHQLSKILGVPVIPASARSNKGLKELMDAVYSIAQRKNEPDVIKVTYDEKIEEAIKTIQPVVEKILNNKLDSRWIVLRLLDSDTALLDSINRYVSFELDNSELVKLINEVKFCLKEEGFDDDHIRDEIVTTLVSKAEEISKAAVKIEHTQYNSTDRKIDSILTSKVFGIPVMLILLGTVFWLTITGANYPSQALSNFLFHIEDMLTELFMSVNSPIWLYGMLIKGVYRTLAWVVSVMLPPMAIFFPLFTLLEDLGYLPRVAFNLDNFFKKACTHGKQALTMCMGFGCNAAGIIGCRIIDSPRERLIAIITNSFVPCNGRFPTLIAIITMFFTGLLAGPFESVLSTIFLTGVISLGVLITLFISKLLSKTILKGLPSSFTLELPPYRKPQIGKVIVRSVFDRTLFVLSRAIVIAAPAGLVIWTMANIYMGNMSLLSHCAAFIDPFAKLLGLDGYILMAFILGFPANEIVVPIIIMSYMASGSIMEINSLQQLRELLVANGWTWLTAICVMLFSLIHWPCGTTVLTVKKETQSWKWTFISFLVPTVTGMAICFTVANVVRLLRLV